MIPNITHSTDSGNYLGYDLGDKREQYQKVQFLAAEGVMLDDRLIDRLNQNWDDGDEKGYQAFRKVSMAIANDLDDQFQAQASQNGRPKIRAINVSLSYSPEDTDKVNEVVYDEAHDDYVPLRLKMGREFMDGMGFGDIQYMAVSHLGTHCAHDHYAINTVRADGSTIKLNFDFVRAQKVAVEIRQKYGLTPPDESLQMITPKAREAMKQSCSWDEYEQRLQEHGIGLVYTDHSKNGRGYGVSYSFGKKVIPGSKLHRSLSYGQVEATLARNLAARQAQEEASRIAAQQELARQKAEEEARAAAEKAAQEAARAAEERRRVAERLSTQTETFVIHNDTAATVYSYRPDWNSKDISMAKKLAMLHEASRSILKYHTWGSDVRINEPKEFVDAAVNGKVFGTVKFDLGKARFVGEDRYDGVLENPEEVIQFADHNGRALDLFTPEFHEDWGMRLDSLKHYLEEKRAKQEAEAAAQRAKSELKEFAEGYNSVVPPIANNLRALKSSTYQLYMQAKDAGLSLSYETRAKYSELSAKWKEFDEQRKKAFETRVTEDVVKFLGGALMCLNPIVGFTAVFVAAIVIDIRQSTIRSQQKQLLTQIDAVRKDLKALKEQKAALTIQKQERLQRYLAAKDMYQEYRDGLQTVDREVKAVKAEIEADERKDVIRRYVASDAAKALLDRINGSFVRLYDHEHLVPGVLVETENGMRWKLYTDGHSDSGEGNRTIYHPHSPAPQEYGESYVDFSINEKGELLAVIEADPVDKYTTGVSGRLNLSTMEGQISVREHHSSLKDYQAPLNSPEKPSYEIVQEFTYTSKYRITKEQNGTMKLQRLDWDKQSPVVNGKYSKTAWFNKAVFTSYEEIGRDADGLYLKIKDTGGKTRYINQNGVDLDAKKKQQLRLGGTSKGYGGPSV